MMRQVMLHGQNKTTAKIVINPTALSYSVNAYGTYQYCTVTVTPSSMSTTLTLRDSGYGTSWASLSVTSGSGTYQFGVKCNSKCDTVGRALYVRIADTSGSANYKELRITQGAAEIE